MTRARRAASARPRRDRSRVSSSVRCSVVNISRVDGMRHRTLYKSWVQGTSWNARSSSPLLPLLFSDYHAQPTDFLDVFKEGVTERQQDLENFGSGDGREFQKLSK